MKGNDNSKVLKMDRYEYGVVIEGLVSLHNSLIEKKQPHDFVDEVLMKTLDAPDLKTRALEMER